MTDMWGPMDPERKREFYTLWQDIKFAGRYVIGAALCWLFVWPFAAAMLWWQGRMDAAFEGLFVVGYVWFFAAVLIAWMYALLRQAPDWVWWWVVGIMAWRILLSSFREIVREELQRARHKQDEAD